MKRLLTSLLTSIVVLAQMPLMALAVDTNLIVNGSFESQANNAPTAWTTNSWGTNTASFAYEPTGQDGAKSATVNVSNYKSGDAKWVPQTVTVAPSTTYTFTDWYRGNVKSSIDAAITTTAGKTTYKWLGDLSVSASWKQAKYTFKTPANASKVTFYHYIEANGSLTTDSYTLVAGNGSTTPTPPPIPPAPVPTAPAVSMTGPAANSTLSGTQTLTASASDGVAVTSVHFQLDGVNLGAADTTAPYSTAWNTVTVVDGVHKLRAIATNNSSLKTTSSEISVTVKNTVDPPTPPTPTPTPTNLIANPSVETASGTAPAAWHGDGWGTNSHQFSYEPTGMDGSKSVKTTMTSHTDGDAKWYFDDIAVTPGKMYNYSNWYKSNVETELDAMVTMTDGTVQYYYLAAIPASPANWRAISAQFTAPANAAKVTIFQVLDKVGYVQSDSFSFAAYQPAMLNRGLVSITFDDGWRNIYTNGLPLLQKYNIPSTQYLLTETTSYPDYMTIAMMREFQTKGHEIGSHTVSHAHLSQLSAAQLATELSNSQTFLRNNFGAQTAKNFATPYGEYNDSVITSIQQYYRSHRSTDVGYNSKDNFNIYNIKVQNVTNETTPAQVKAWVDTAVATKTWLVIVYHEVTATAEDPTYAVTPANLDAELNIVKQSGVTVKTVDQALDEIVPQL